MKFKVGDRVRIIWQNTNDIAEIIGVSCAGVAHNFGYDYNVKYLEFDFENCYSERWLDSCLPVLNCPEYLK